MTFKAVFLNFWPSGQSGHRVQGAKSGGFGLQHTDFARRCQPFYYRSGGAAGGRNGPVSPGSPAGLIAPFEGLGGLNFRSELSALAGVTVTKAD
jgi:hypothetical protein